MQDEDDERRDLERALYSRPSGDDDEIRRLDAERRLLTEARAEAAAPPPEPPREPPAADAPGHPSPPPAATPRSSRRRVALIAAGALAGGLVLGAGAASVVGTEPPVRTPSPTPSAAPLDRFADLVEGWQPAADLPVGLALISRGADVYTPAFETAQNDRLLLSAPDGTRLCLALERQDGSLSASCTALDTFFDGGALDVVGTATDEGVPVYTRVTLRPDGSVEGGFQLVPTPTPTPGAS